MISKFKWLLKSGLKTELRAQIQKWPGKLEMGRNVIVDKTSCLDRYMGGNIKIGDNCYICAKSKIATCGGNINIGNGVTIGERAIITAQGDVTIEDNVLFADRVTIIANEHIYNDVNIPIKEQGSYCKPIKIGEGSWLGINVTILQGTIIGKNCVVGAGSVVKGEFPDYCVIAGNPAKIIKIYDSETSTWKKL